MIQISDDVGFGVVVFLVSFYSSVKLSDNGVKCFQKFRHVILADLNHLSVKAVVLHLRVSLDCGLTKREIEFAAKTIILMRQRKEITIASQSYFRRFSCPDREASVTPTARYVPVISLYAATTTGVSVFPDSCLTREIFILSLSGRSHILKEGIKP